MSQSALSAAQREIMEIFWERQAELTASDIRTVLVERREVSRNTVRTLVERMEQKGWLSHRIQGRTFWYRATRQREHSIAQQVGAMLEKVCGGSPETLVSALLDYRGLTRSELDRVRSLLSEAKARRRAGEAKST